MLRELGLRAPSGTNIKNLSPTATGDTVSPVPKTTAQVAAEVGLSERSLQQRLQIATQVAADVHGRRPSGERRRPVVGAGRGSGQLVGTPPGPL